MKELTIEQKAEAYNQAFRIAQELYNNPNSSKIGKGYVLAIFPELKENEDEKIRKALIRFHKSTNIDGIKGADILAWLEKQGDKDKLIQELGEYKVKYTQEVLEKHINSMSNKDDERLRKTTIAFLKDFADKGYENAIECIDWLEKQGEYKPQGKTALEAIKEEKVDNANKVEPKFNFKVGQWLVATGKCVYLIIKIDDFDVTLVDTNGNEYVFDASSLNDSHEWTIEDAKDGDVLSYRDGQWIFIYKGIITEDTFNYCALLSEKCIIVNDAAFSFLISRITPATKEQRDKLEKAMNDAGWEFDFDKKELKKIEQKHTSKHKVGDTIYYNSFGKIKSMVVSIVVIDSTGNPMYEDKEGNDVFEKDLVEQKPTWSEEDEKMYASIIDDTVQENQLDGKQIDWLRNIKHRNFARPQNTWKPSDEQMDALLKLEEMHVLEHEKNQENAHLYMVVKSLREQLLKLREE